MTETKRASFTTRLTLAENGGGYEIHCMTAGVGNGWTISPSVLQTSRHLWDRIPSYLDHAWQGHSVRDLCGHITSPTWDEEAKGIKATFNPIGPGKDVARAMAADVLANPEMTANVGFSADLNFKYSGKNVTEIVGINSVDLVLDPARGGKWLRALNQKKGTNMEDQELDPTTAALDEARKENELMRVQMCAAVLQSTLLASNLPAPAQDAIREDFSNKTFEIEDLNKRIERDRKVISTITAGQFARSGQLSGMVNPDDELTAAVQDLFGVERDEKLKNVQAARLTGIRELYHGLTGDFEMHGSINPGRALFQMTTANFPVLVKNAMNKALMNAWAEFGRAGYNWWEQIATVQHFSTLNQITWSMFGTVGSLPTVLEGAEYTPIKIGDNGELSSFVKKGGYFAVTLEAIDRDDMRAIKAAPRELAFAGIREISALVAALFTDNSNVGPTLADTGALFNATAVTTAGGHANLLTTAIGTDYIAWEAVASAMYNQPMLVANETGYYGTGKKMAIDPKFILVPRALRGAANNLFLSRDIPGATQTITSGKEWYGMVIPVTVPEWTDANDWAAVADPRLMPAVMIGERFGITPEIYIAGNETDPAVFMNDESRIKVRHFVAVGVCDFRPLHKSNV